MLLQRLYELRQTIPYETPESYKKRDVHFAVEIDAHGNFGDIVRIGEGEGKKQALVMATPDRIRGGSTPPPLLFVDKAQYVLATVDPKEEVKALTPEMAHQNFAELINELFASCTPETEGYDLLQAVRSFLQNGQRQRATDELNARYADRDNKDKIKIYKKHEHPEKNHFFALRVAGQWLHTLPCAMAFWAALCRQDSAPTQKTTSVQNKKATKSEPAGKNGEGDRVEGVLSSSANDQDKLLSTVVADAPNPEEDAKPTQKKARTKKAEEAAPDPLPCLITGDLDKPIARLHDEIKLGAQPCQIVSANSNAFLSYGHEQSLTSPVSQDAMKAYTEALRYLLEDRRSHAFVGGTGYVYWSKNGTTGLPIDIFDEVQPEAISALLRAPFSGQKAHVEQAKGADFYAASLRSNQKRMIIRDYLETTLEEVKRHLKHWFDGHAIVFLSFDATEAKEDLRYFGLKRLASAFTRDATGEFKEMEKLSPLILDALFHAAMTGRPLPLTLLAQLLLRIRKDGRLSQCPQRAALLRVILNTHQATETPMNASLDPQQQRPAYLCGRLFAVLEDLQRAALGKINASIADRFMGTASSAPASVFGRLLRGAQPHLQFLRKNNEPAYHAIQQRIEEILQHLPSFPMLLDLKDQGVFALGYYHQRHATRAEIRARKDLKALQSLLDEPASTDVSAEHAA